MVKERYIIGKEGIELLGISTIDAVDRLAESVVLSDEHLNFSHLPYASVFIDEVQAQLLKDNSIHAEKEVIKDNIVLGVDYERVRTYYYRKIVPRNITGIGCKVGNLDSGCRLIGTPNVSPVWTNYDIGVNLIDASGLDDVFNHGTRTSSSIKSSVGLANGCELHVIKVINNTGGTTESAMLAGLNYCITNHIDIVNMSFSFDTNAFRVGIASLIAAGCVISAGSGNSSLLTFLELPSGLPGVVAVNSIKEDGTPNYYNLLPNVSTPGSHGITIACSGVNCEGINNLGSTAGAFGTSFSCPFFCGVFALYKEKLKLSDNYAVLNYILESAIKSTIPHHYGAGFLTF